VSRVREHALTPAKISLSIEAVLLFLLRLPPSLATGGLLGQLIAAYTITLNFSRVALAALGLQGK